MKNVAGFITGLSILFMATPVSAEGETTAKAGETCLSPERGEASLPAVQIPELETFSDCGQEKYDE